MKKFNTLWIVAFLCTIQFASAQNVGIGTNNPDPKAKLEIESTVSGALMPRMTTAQRNAISASPAVVPNGLLVYDTDEDRFYFWDESIGGSGDWNEIVAQADSDKDWYEEGTTAGPNDINDNIFTHGNVGIGASSPTHKLHVVGDIWAEGKFVVQNNQDGGLNRGIYMWNAGDTNWGIYMGQSGSAKSLSGGIATAGAGFNSHAIRFRVNDNANQGFVFENSSEENLFSVRGSDGMSYHAGNVGIGVVPTARLHVNGTVRLQGISEGAGKVLVSDANGNATWSNDLPDNDVGYIWNQNGTDQSANFRINGTGQQSKVIATANGDWYLRGGDDHELRDINRANFVGIWGRSTAADGGIQLGSGDAYLYGDNGNIGIGLVTPAEKLSVFTDTDNSAEIGRAHVGFIGHGDWAGFSHIDANTGNNYALIQNSSGRTLLNSAPGQEIEFRNNNTTYAKQEATGIWDFDKAIRLDCPSCGSATDINGSSSWGDVVIQGRVFSSSENLHLSPPGGTKVIINDTYRAAGGSNTGGAGLQVESLEGTGNRPVMASSDGTVFTRKKRGFSISSNLHPSYDDYSYTNLLNSCSDDATFNFTISGFNFYIDEVRYENFWISTNGILGFGTSPTSAFSNTSLPTAYSSNPMLFFHWDDHSAFRINYTVQGTSPNRICHIYWEGDISTNCSSSDFDVYLTIHEGANTVSVRYVGIENATDTRGRSATIGFQKAGGSSATEYATLSQNADFLDDNRFQNFFFSVDMQE